MDTDPNCCTDKLKNLNNPHWSNRRTVTYSEEDVYEPDKGFTKERMREIHIRTREILKMGANYHRSEKEVETIRKFKKQNGTRI
jgi:hypothetical protein